MSAHLVVGRYLLHRRIARGGMATIHIARLLGDVGFSRIVAAKRMHPDLAEDAEFVTMFLDEARIASRVQHRNVVNVLDVVTLGDEVMLVQEYVHGAPLSVLLRVAYETNAHVPVPVAAAIACQVLAGLHAAHETVDELGCPLQIVHRDVSPQNILIAIDGSARLLDFGVAKAALSSHVTRKGTFKGKLGYSSPEQIRGEAKRQSDIYSLGVVLWEMIVGHRLRPTQSDAQLIAEILGGYAQPITEALADARHFMGAYRWGQLEAIEPIIRKALDVNARRRWQTAADMEDAISAAVPLAPAADVVQWLRAVGREFLDERERLIGEEEASWRRNAHMFDRHTEAPHEVQLDDAAHDTPEPDNSAGASPTVPTAGQRPHVVRTSDAVGKASTATEPQQSRSSLVRSVSTAIISTIVIAMVATFGFVVRDLHSSTTPTPAAERARAVPHARSRALPATSPAISETLPVSSGAAPNLSSATSETLPMASSGRLSSASSCASSGASDTSASGGTTTAASAVKPTPHATSAVRRVKRGAPPSSAANAPGSTLGPERTLGLPDALAPPPDASAEPDDDVVQDAPPEHTEPAPP